MNNKFDQLNRFYFQNEFSIYKLTEDDNKNIDYYKATYIVNETPDITFLRYPGFVFSSKNDAILYYNNFYKDIENVFTPPRGNLSKVCKYVFVGIKPAPGVVDSKAECCWFFGTTSTFMLHKLLVDLEIYPYFTNVYLDYKRGFDKDLTLTFKELYLIKNICPNITFVFMGKYEEYDMLIEKMNLKNYKKIWHPGFLVRSFTEEKFSRWKEQIL